MRIAVASEGTNVTGHFGHCDSFIIFDAENGKGSYLKARSSEICEMLVKRFGLDLSKKKKRATVKKSDDAEDEE